MSDYKIGVLVSIMAGSFAGIASHNIYVACAVTFGLGALGIFIQSPMSGGKK